MLPISFLLVYVIRIVRKRKITTTNCIVIALGLISTMLIFAHYHFEIDIELDNWANGFWGIVVALTMIVVMYSAIYETNKLVKNNKLTIKTILIVVGISIGLFVLKKLDLIIQQKADALVDIDILVNDYGKLFGYGPLGQYLETQVFIFSYIPEGLIFLVLFVIAAIILYTNKQNKAINYLKVSYSCFMFLYLFEIMFRIGSNYVDSDFDGYQTILFTPNNIDYYNHYYLAIFSFSIIFIIAGFIFINLLNNNSISTEEETCIELEPLENTKLDNWLNDFNAVYIFMLILWLVNNISYSKKYMSTLQYISYYKLTLNTAGMLYIINVIMVVVSSLLLLVGSYLHLRITGKEYKSKAFNVFGLTYVIHITLMLLVGILKITDVIM